MTRPCWNALRKNWNIGLNVCCVTNVVTLRIFEHSTKKLAITSSQPISDAFLYLTYFLRYLMPECAQDFWNTMYYSIQWKQTYQTQNKVAYHFLYRLSIAKYVTHLKAQKTLKSINSNDKTAAWIQILEILMILPI